VRWHEWFVVLMALGAAVLLAGATLFTLGALLLMR
jgi:hypothetical protein